MFPMTVISYPCPLPKACKVALKKVRKKQDLCPIDFKRIQARCLRFADFLQKCLVNLQLPKLFWVCSSCKKNPKPTVHPEDGKKA